MSDENGSKIIENSAQVSVLLPLVFHEAFDYRVPAGMDIRTGDYVRVPFGRRSLWGVVWGKGSFTLEEKKIKAIECLAAHLPPMNETMRNFIDFVSWYTLAARGPVLKMALSCPDALEPPVQELRYQLSEQSTIRLTPARTRINAYLSGAVPRSSKEITAHAKVSAAVVREYIKSGGLKEVTGCLLPVAGSGKGTDPWPLATGHLSAAQETAAAELRKKLAAGFSVSVLDGVTGSGKTEVYFDTIAHCIAAGKQALVLLPEIALSVQWLSRFESRFGFAPDVWHSSVSAAKKRTCWRNTAEGSARVIVGARSALFLPFRNLGAIVVDEEHDASYKQEEGVIYQARDMAVARASREKIPAVLVSATPSLETEYNIEHKRYTRLHLPNRYNDAEMPKVQLVDMRSVAIERGNWISGSLRQALLTTLAAKRQAMLFMNRRGYAPLMLCRACGHRFQCPQCTASLVVHRAHAKLLCHHCGHIVPTPKQCPDCKHEDCLIPYGPGVERVAEEVRALLPDARIEVMTSDHIDSPAKAEVLVNDMINGKIDVLVGTQMIAKGHHFAGLALIGVIDADMGLAGGDLRASERTYQLLHQLSGRAGREKTKGEVWLQTYMPEHPVMQALSMGKRDEFMLLEARLREDAGMPPYGKLAAVIVEGKNEQEVMAFARELVRDEARGAMGTGKSDVTSFLAPISLPLILGPAPAPMFLLRGKYRYRILIKTERQFPLQQFLSRWLLERKIPASLRVKIDVEPYSFM